MYDLNALKDQDINRLDFNFDFNFGDIDIQNIPE